MFPLSQSTWIGTLHHVCDEHEWTGGKCGHGELEEHNLPWFDRRDKDFEALQKVILDAQLLESFQVRFMYGLKFLMTLHFVNHINV